MKKTIIITAIASFAAGTAFWFLFWRKRNAITDQDRKDLLNTNIEVSELTDSTSETSTWEEDRYLMDEY